MAINFGITPVSPDDLFKRMVKQLSDSGTPSGSNLPGAGLDDRAFLSMWPDKMHLLHPKSKEFVAVRPTRFPVWQSIVTGSGRDTTGFNGVVSTTLFYQNSSDPETASTQVLTEDALNITRAVMRVVSALQFWNPLDESGNAMLREWCRLLDDGLSFQSYDGQDGPWTYVTMSWSLVFTVKLPTL